MANRGPTSSLAAWPIVIRTGRLLHRLRQRLGHLVEAGSDFFLMPSAFEPCGLNQMYSLAYGTRRWCAPPVVWMTVLQTLTSLPLPARLQVLDQNRGCSVRYGRLGHLDLSTNNPEDWQPCVETGMAKRLLGRSLPASRRPVPGGITEEDAVQSCSNSISRRSLCWLVICCICLTTFGLHQRWPRNDCRLPGPADRLPFHQGL